jgi:zinc protease
VDYLESIGTKFGPHLNAYTSFDETVYMIQLPTDKPEILDKGLQIMEDWAHNLLFDSLEVEKERGVVVEEWRLGQGADERMRRVYWPVLFRDSRYAERLPIGKKEIIEHCPQATLRNFYNDWYRPELMAVILVGDFDPDAMEAKVKAQFGKVPSKPNPRLLVKWPVPAQQDLAISTVTDKEARYAQIQLIYKRPVESRTTEGDYRRSLAQQLFTGMLNNRMGELQRMAEPPFLYAGSDYGNFVRNVNAYYSFAISKGEGIEKALQTVLEENERVRRFGFTESELKRQKSDMMTGIEKAYNERDKTESRNFAREYVSNYLEDEPMPGISIEYDLYKKYVDGISLAEVNAFAKEWMSQSQNAVVIITAPEKETTKMPSDSRIREMVGGMERLDLKPYEDKVVDKPLVEGALKGGSVVNTREIKELGITEWQLDNGVKIACKPTDFKNDEILFTSFSWGGWSQYDVQDYPSAAACDEIIDEAGLGEFDATALEKLLAGKMVSCSPYVGELTEGFNGSCAPKDLETMFQLIYKYFTDPRKDAASFQSYVTKQKGFLQNRGSDPQSVFMDTVAYAMSGYNPRFRPRTPESVDAISLDRAFAIYKERFADASGFTFFFVGNVKPEDIRTLSQKYLGSLPATRSREMWKDINAYPPKGKVERTVYKGSEPRSTVMMRFNTGFDFNRKNRNEVNALTKLLSIRLREVLREDKSGVYGVSCQASPKKFPANSLEFLVYFSCSPDNVEPLTKAALDVFEEVKSKGCDEKNLVKIKETALRERETNLKENQFWLSLMSSSAQNGEDVTEILSYQDWVNKLSTADIQTFAAKYLQLDNYARFILLPEKK